MTGKPTNEELAQRIEALEKELAEVTSTNASLSLALDVSDSGFYFWNLKTNEITFDRRFFENVLYSFKELGEIAKDFMSVLHPDERDNTLAGLNAHLQGKTPMYTHEHRVLAKTGDWKWVSNRAKVIEWDKDGNPERLIGTVREITERKEAEEALRESEEKFRSLVENAPNFISILDQDGTIQFINRTVPEIIPEEVIGKKSYDHADPEYHALMKKTIKHVFRTGERSGYTIRGLGQQSTASWYDVQVGPIKRDGKTVAVTEILTDITKPKRAEQALRESEEKYRELVETIEELIWEVDTQGIYTYVSPQAHALYGFAAKDVMGKTPFDFMPPKEARRVKTLFKQIVKSQKPFLALESRSFHKDDHLVFMENTGSPFFSHDGTLLGYRGIAIDITEHKLAEEALRESEEKYRLLAENASDVIWTMDMELNLTYISPSVIRQRGYTAEEALSQKIEQILTPDSYQVALATISQALEEDEKGGKRYLNKPYVVELELTCKDGSTLWTEHQASLLHDPEGQPIGFIGITRDISERKKAQDALKQSEERLALAVQATKDGIWDWNISEDTAFTSPNLRKMLGVDEGIDPRSLFESWNSRIHPDHRDHMADRLRQHLKGRAPFNVDFLFGDLTGQYRWQNINGMALFDENGRAYRMVGAIQDIHDRKQAEQHVRTLTQKLIEAQENERQMISRELHDRVAQDLSSSKIACDLLLNHEPGLTNKVMKKVSEISNTLNSSIFAVRDLAYDLRPPGLEDLGLIQTVFLYCEDFSEKSRVNVDFHYAGIDNLALSLYAEINIFRLIQEGLNNIWKHADATHAIVRLLGAFPNIILRIEDNGKGFDVSQRLSVAIDEKRMGLRSMEERAGLLRGNMTLQSKPNEGTIISVKFPYKENKSE